MAIKREAARFVGSKNGERCSIARSLVSALDFFTDIAMAVAGRQCIFMLLAIFVDISAGV